MQRVIFNYGTAFVPLQDAIHHQFYPAVFGGPVSEIEVQLSDLPACAGGLGISDSVESISMAFSSSLRSSAALWAPISGGQAEFSPAVHLEVLDSVCCEASAVRGEHIQSALSSLLTSVSSSTCLPLRGLLILEFLAGLPYCHWPNIILICLLNSFVMPCL